MSDDPEATDPGPARRSTDLPPDAPWWMRWIVANFREGWRWFSVQWPIICAGLIQLYTWYPNEISEFVPAKWMPHLASAAFILTAVLRFINQPPKEKP